MADIWTHEETRDSVFARASIGGFEIEVQDFDGDLSKWEITIDGNVIANGSAAMWNHFEACKGAAWATIHSFEVTPSGYVMTIAQEGEG